MSRGIRLTRGSSSTAPATGPLTAIHQRIYSSTSWNTDRYLKLWQCLTSAEDTAGNADTKSFRLWVVSVRLLSSPNRRRPYRSDRWGRGRLRILVGLNWLGSSSVGMGRESDNSARTVI